MADFSYIFSSVFGLLVLKNHFCSLKTEGVEWCGGGIIEQFLMLLNSLVLPNGTWQMQLFQINQSEDSSKITIMYNNPSVQLHQRSIT